MNLASDGTVVHGFFNCNRMNEESRDEEPEPDFKSNQMMIVYATRFSKNSRSVDSTSTYINHLRKQIEAKALTVPAAFQFFKGYGDMNFLMSMDGSVSIGVDRPRREEEVEERKDEADEEVKEKYPAT